MRIHEIAHTRVHYGYRRVHVMLSREGYRDNHQRVYRSYREKGLSLRHKRSKRDKSAQRRQPIAVAQAINDIWSMDFVMDQLFGGRRLRALTLVDSYTRECLAIDIGQNLRGDDVVATLGRVWALRGLPRVIKTQRQRVHLQSHGHMGTGKWGGNRLQPARQADGQCALRILQWPLPSGMPEQPLVLVICRRQGENRRLADVL